MKSGSFPFLIFLVVQIFIKCGSCLQTEWVVNERPIIGILAQEVSADNSNQTYIAASYVKFVEGSGAQVVPIFVNQNESYVRDIFSKINGVLFPGGGVYFSATNGTEGYVGTGRLLYKLAKEANDAGDYFPVWGTCLGFELMMYLDADGGIDPRATCGAWNVVEKLKFTKETMTSDLFSSAPKAIVNSLSSLPLTANFHRMCLTPQNFTSFGLSKSYASLSINYDSSSNMTYISTVAHRRYPFYAVQFHPEKNIYEWTTKEKLPHSAKAIAVGQYFANFFVAQARRNTHKFATIEEENKNLIYNYVPQFVGADGSTFVQKYFF